LPVLLNVVIELIAPLNACLDDQKWLVVKSLPDEILNEKMAIEKSIKIQA
jgi:hypothetical protein